MQRAQRFSVSKVWQMFDCKSAHACESDESARFNEEPVKSSRLRRTTTQALCAVQVCVGATLLFVAMAPHGLMEPQAMAPGGLQNTTSPVPLDTVLQLLTGPDSKVLALRHIAALEALARKNSAGFYMSDLERVCSIMDVTIRAIKQGELQFVSAMCLLLRCGIHFHCWCWPQCVSSWPVRTSQCIDAELWAFRSGKSLSQTRPQ